jgi:hypothetical protein
MEAAAPVGSAPEPATSAKENASMTSSREKRFRRVHLFAAFAALGAGLEALVLHFVYRREG